MLAAFRALSLGRKVGGLLAVVALAGSLFVGGRVSKDCTQPKVSLLESVIEGEQQAAEIQAERARRDQQVLADTIRVEQAIEQRSQDRLQRIREADSSACPPAESIRSASK